MFRPSLAPQIIARIDQLNSEDPNQELVDGAPQPREVVYSTRLTEWVRRLDPEPSEALQIAARGQHVQRWTIPRERYERTRGGYLRWREVLKSFHAQTVEAIMRELGSEESLIQRVRLLILKKLPPTDPEMQTLEDALCLVFLETQFTELRQKTADEKMEEIVRKTWKKMSDRGRRVALQLPLSEHEKAFLTKVLSAG